MNYAGQEHMLPKMGSAPVHCALSTQLHISILQKYVKNVLISPTQYQRAPYFACAQLELFLPQKQKDVRRALLDFINHLVKIILAVYLPVKVVNLDHTAQVKAAQHAHYVR